MQALCEAAVDVALGAGASYADARAVSLRRQLVVTKNRNVDDVSDAESEGIGVRVLVDGAWGFAADRRLDEAGAREAALRACAVADGLLQIRSYPSQHSGVSGQGGWEFVERLGLDSEAPRVGEQAAALLN